MKHLALCLTVFLGLAISLTVAALPAFAWWVEEDGNSWPLSTDSERTSVQSPNSKERAAALKRKKAGKPSVESTGGPLKGQSRDRVAASVGISGRTGDNDYAHQNRVNPNRYDFYDTDFNSQGTITYNPWLDSWVYTDE